MPSKKMLLAATAIVALIVSTGVACKKHNTAPNPPVEVKTSYVEVMHASPRTADIEVTINGVSLPAKIKYLDNPAAYVPVLIKDSETVQLSANGAVIAQGVSRMVKNYKYTMFVYDTLDASKKAKYLLVQDTFPSPGSGKCNIRFLHLAPQLASVDVDLFEGKDSLRLASACPYSGTKASDGTFRPIPAGDYRLKVRSKSAGASAVVLDIASLKLEKGKTYSLFLYGLVKGTGNNKLGLQLLPHK